MATKTLSASLDPALYERTRRAARQDGRKQSAVVAEALSLYTLLPTELRQLLRDLGLARSPAVAAQLAERLRGAVLELRWQLLLGRIRDTLDPAVKARLEAVSAEQLDALADEAVRSTRRAR